MKIKQKTNWLWMTLFCVIAVFTMMPMVSKAESNVEINETNFPDANFRSYVSEKFDDGDGILSSDEIAAVTSISCWNVEISSLEGIEYFTSLMYLDCYGISLTSLDMSNNTALKELRCRTSNLSSLDVSKNKELTLLYCDYNNLSSLDISNNTKLKTIYCYSNNLTSLDVSKASNWYGGSVSGNILTVESNAGYVSYTYDIGFGDPETFYLDVDCKQHIHCLDGGTVTKATTSKNGMITHTCSDCGETVSFVIYYPKTITLSATSYTYNGSTKNRQ